MPLRPHQFDATKAMFQHSKGQIIIPTGGGKTMCMIDDAEQRFRSTIGDTIVVVAPRILLAEQLSSEFLEILDNVSVMHVHSGETYHYSTTNSHKIRVWNNNTVGNKIIFTTYHSLHRIVESDISIDTIYFDEAHNSVQRNFFSSVKFYGTMGADRCFFFTATPKHSTTVKKAGMNNREVYGDVIINVPAPKLVDEGYILPPKVEVYKLSLIHI